MFGIAAFPGSTLAGLEGSNFVNKVGEDKSDSQQTQLKQDRQVTGCQNYMHNPSLREEPLKGRAPTVPMSDTLSILDWLKDQGRLIESASTNELNHSKEEDITVLLGEEEKYDDDDDD